ncbi:N-acetyl-L,L-diaminopimelate deacetylase [Klebsiella pneumoniae]|nr:N-acetyl-L,L-diaminopimelate deacetylase [Klebsiella pneumoniae]
MQKTTLLLAVALAFSASSWGQDVKINGTGVSLEANKTPIHTAKNPQAIALLPKDLHLAVPGKFTVAVAALNSPPLTVFADIHTSVMLGAALLLKEREAELPGRVRILFQPAEENFGGAKTLIRAGALEEVSAIFGMHNEPGLPVGEFATRGGAFYANVDRFVFKVTGKGAHAARPHEGKDAILLASQLVTVLQSVASREVNTLDSVVLSVTRIQGGNTWNVLPESVELEGTLRTHSSEVQQRVKARVSEIAAGFASAFGAQIDVFWYAGPTALVNDARWADFASDVAAQAGYRTHHADLHLGGEDFAVYLQHIPGAFVSIGSASEYGLHHPAFNPDERLIAPAAHYFAQLAEQALQHI